MANRVHRSLKVVAFNANVIERQRFMICKQLQAQCIDVALLSKTYLKAHEKFIIQNYVYWADRQPGLKGGTAVAVTKGIPHIHVDFPPHVSIEATEVCIPIGNKGVLLCSCL
jgi:hypothetical protein